jgi:hypothetical protein
MASPTPYALNDYGVQVQSLDYTKFPQSGSNAMMTYHAGSIVVNGKIIGRIDNWQPAGAFTREGSHVYEVSNQTWGVPVDYVPGRATGFNITWTRGEIWNQELELALGYRAVWKNLTDQTHPFVANEMLFKGATLYRTWIYSGCWFTEKNHTEWSSEGDGRIKVNCAMAYVSRNRTS